MTNQEQVFVEGFVKRANEHGIDENQTIKLLKTAGSGSAVRNLTAGMFKSPRKTFGAFGGAIGGIHGGLLGGLAGGGIGGAVGGVNGLINPEQGTDPETGELVNKSRIMSALKGGLKGTAIGAAGGAGIGAGIGGVAGAIVGGEAGKSEKFNFRKMRRTDPEMKQKLEALFNAARNL